MICNARIIRLASAAIAACFMLASAPASAQGVKIGILNDQSGTFADYGGKGSVEAAKMAIEDFGGSVLGQKIELVSADHQNSPDLASAIARRWYDAEGVDMITELTTSSVALAVQQIAGEKKKIDIVVGGLTSALTGSACTPYGFHWAFDTHAAAVSTGGALAKTRAGCFWLESRLGFPNQSRSDSTCWLGGGQQGMPKPYSQDLRDRVIDAVERGEMSRRAAARRYAISESVAIKWLERVERDGSREPVGHGGHRASKLMPHRDFLQAARTEKTDVTLQALCDRLSAERGVKADTSMMSRFFRKIGVTFKKRPSSRASRIVPT